MIIPADAEQDLRTSAIAPHRGRSESVLQMTTLMQIPEAHIISAEQATALTGPVGGPLHLALHGARTGGRFTALTNEVAPGAGPPLHLHLEQDEVWYVLSGTLRFRLNDSIEHASTGAWAFVPRGTAHTFQNIGTEPAHVLVMFTPAGMEPFFEHLPKQPTDADVARLGEPCGMRVLGPSLAISHPG